MPPFAMLLCAGASVLGALIAAPLDADLRLVSAASIAALAFYCMRGGSHRLRFIILFAVMAGAASAAIHQLRAHTVVERRTARYAGVLLDGVTQTDGSTDVTLALDDGRHVLARIRGSAPPAGTRVIVRGRLEPFDEARNPGEPSERALEAERGLDGRLDAAALLSATATRDGGIAAWLARAHQWAHAQLLTGLGEPAASVVAGELWGERAALPPLLRNEFQETGTVHVLVTAGLHVGAIAACALGLALVLTVPRAAACALTILIVWCFTAWSGAQLPAMRAAVMATTMLAARACGRPTLSWNALAIAAIAIVLLRPASVASSSFALSFSCVAAIFAYAAPLERWFEEHIAIPDRVREAVVLSIATQIGVWPLSAAIFLQFTPYGVLANATVVPFVAITMALGAAQVALAWCGPLAHACANLNSWLLAWTLSVVGTLSALPHAAIPMTPAPAYCIALYDAALAAAPWLWKRGAQTLACAAIVIAAGFVVWPPRFGDRSLRVTVLDVGQADAIVLQTPAGHTLLVDAGGRLERGAQGDDSTAERVGERTVVPFLLRHGMHAVDTVIISHPHGDHAGGVAPVLRHLRVAQMADGGQRYGGHAFVDAMATARTQNVPVVYPRAGMQWETDDGVILHFIGPSLPFIEGPNAINSNSIAFLLTYGTFRMLFTGDAGSESERRFLDEGVDLHADVLKVGHHGSAYGSSPQFIAAVRPKYAIISVGRHNLFGHPAVSTLQTLERFGVGVYRTDRDGAVTIVSDGRSEMVSSMFSHEGR
jgi:competence protein ComEC